MNYTNQIWHFGKNAAVKFNLGIAEDSGIGSIFANYGSGVMTDSLGNIVFSTDGVHIYPNGENQPATGVPLDGSPASGAIQIIPGFNCHEYNIILIDRFPSWSTSFFDVGFPYVNEPVPQNSIRPLIWIKYDSQTQTYVKNTFNELPADFQYCEKIAVISKGDKYLVLSLARKLNNSGYPNNESTVIMIYELSCNGFIFVNSFQLDNVSCSHIGQIKVSPDGKFLAYANWFFRSTVILNISYQGNDISSITLAEQITHIQNINSNDANELTYLASNYHYGIEFSNNSRKLYFTIVANTFSGWLPNDSYIFQVDLNAGFSFSLIHHHIYQLDQNTDSGTGDPDAMQLGNYGLGMLQNNYGNIYFTIPGTKKLGRISNIDSNSPIVVEDYLILTNVSKHGLPNNVKLIGEFDSGIFYNLNEINQSLIDSNLNEIELNKCDDICNVAYNLPEPCIFVNTVQFGANGCHPFIVKISNDTRLYTYKNVKIGIIEIYDSNNNLLAYSSNAELSIVPKGEICFGDIGPCQSSLREFAIRSYNALNSYTVKLRNISYEISNTIETELTISL